MRDPAKGGDRHGDAGPPRERHLLVARESVARPRCRASLAARRRRLAAAVAEADRAWHCKFSEPLLRVMAGEVR